MTRCDQTRIEVKQHPILFSGPMVHAILSGRKTQTRRVVKVRAGDTFVGAPRRINCHTLDGGGYGFFSEEADYRCPFGKPGDRLWVRETWGLPPSYDPDVHGDLRTKPIVGPVVYGASYSMDGHGGGGRRQPWDNETIALSGRSWRWRPSIHMPRWASRITLEVVAVRVERVQAIEELDALAEGCIGERVEGELNGVPGTCVKGPARAEFRQLWDEINSKRGFPWADSPWVWVVEFKRG